MSSQSKSNKSSSSSDSDSSSSHAAWTCNEGDSSDCDEEAPAKANLRGKVAIVTASCPRQYLRESSDRKKQSSNIPADMEAAKDFLAAFRRIVGSQCNQTLEMAAGVAGFHARKRKSTQQRERKMLLAIRFNNNFPHQRVAEAFQQKHGIKISFCFKLPTFGAVLKHMMAAEDQSAEEFNAAAATYPPKLDLLAEIAHDAPTLPIVTDPKEDPWTDNEGDSTDAEEEVAADQSLRGQTTLITAACPRQYPRELEARRTQRQMIPEDFGKEEFLTKLRRTIAKHCSAKVEKATCHSEPHKRISCTTKKRVRHYHVAMKLSANFAHKKVAEAFYREHGIRISFSFKLNRFVGNLQYLMEPGKKVGRHTPNLLTWPVLIDWPAWE